MLCVFLKKFAIKHPDIGLFDLDTYGHISFWITWVSLLSNRVKKQLTN